MSEFITYVVAVVGVLLAFVLGVRKGSRIEREYWEEEMRSKEKNGAKSAG